VHLDDRGFVKTGDTRETDRTPGLVDGHQGTREPTPAGGTTASEQYRSLTLRTSLPGVFAIGDVRSTSAKRVASAVGDGAAVVSQLHQYLSMKRE
jgi:thioredoxin reductase (NADPH)